MTLRPYRHTLRSYGGATYHLRLLAITFLDVLEIFAYLLCRGSVMSAQSLLRQGEIARITHIFQIVVFCKEQP